MPEAVAHGKVARGVAICGSGAICLGGNVVANTFAWELVEGRNPES